LGGLLSSQHNGDPQMWGGWVLKKRETRPKKGGGNPQNLELTSDLWRPPHYDWEYGGKETVIKKECPNIMGATRKKRVAWITGQRRGEGHK